MSRIRIILQARTSSARLPAKVLLPVGGLPLSVLCAERLGRGLELVLATSTDPTDDVLAMLAHHHGLRVFRGQLDNVAHRYLGASADLDDDALVVRATADNPVPDACIVRHMLADFTATGRDYLGSDSYIGSPYGLGVEVFRLGAFRRSVENSADAATAEHVTTALRSAEMPRVSNPYRFTLSGLEGLRVTVDTFEDYIIAARAFSAFGDPIRAGWAELTQQFGVLLGRQTNGPHGCR
jgi:spore coat polysaccharide biosynthesis protein SpsF (cytidylyltransferase family)